MIAMDGTEGGIFGLGEPNDAFAQYFIGQSYLNVLNKEGVPISNVTFEPGCRNNWHIHHAETGGGQILLCTDGRGWYQAWGGEGQRAPSGGCGLHPCRREALARSGEGQLVLARCDLRPRDRHKQRMAGAGGRRAVRVAGVIE